jgi:lysophospholipase L1-like esterase
VIVLTSLAAVSACDMLNGSQSPAAPSSPLPNVVNYSSVGASDAFGVGSSVVCVPFTPCTNGMGYVSLLVRRFQSDGKTVNWNNPSFPGNVLSPEILAIGNSLGRNIPNDFLDGELPFVSADATLVTIFAGGNDANTIGAAVDAGFGGSDPNGYMNTEIQHFGRDMTTLVTGVKSKAPSARIVILNLPNLAGLPYASGYTLAQKQGLQKIAVGFSAQINTMTAQGALVVDLMCDANFYQSSTFSSDGFHPNDAGYAYLASIVYPVATTGQASQPKTSCAQMTLY